jgi:hypothetical protein
MFLLLYLLLILPAAVPLLLLWAGYVAISGLWDRRNRQRQPRVADPRPSWARNPSLPLEQRLEAIVGGRYRVDACDGVVDAELKQLALAFESQGDLQRAAVATAVLYDHAFVQNEAYSASQLAAQTADCYRRLGNDQEAVLWSAAAARHAERSAAQHPGYAWLALAVFGLIGLVLWLLLLAMI